MEKDIVDKLTEAALQGMENAFTPNNAPNDVRFGAAVLTKKGNVYASGQYFSDTYSLTIHAEQGALVHAAAHGEYDIIAIAIISNQSGDQQTNPCHMCKQLLYENYLRSQYNIEVLLLDAQGRLVERARILDMANFPWPPDIKRIKGQSTII